MRRNMLNFLVDAVTLLAIFAMIASGLVIRFVLPPGTGGRYGGSRLELWGMSRHDWGGAHFWAAAVLGVFLVIHVALHWSWVCAMLRGLLGNKNGLQPSTSRHNAYGIGFMIAIVAMFGGFLWYADNAVKEATSPQNSEFLSENQGEDTRTPQAGHLNTHGHGHESIRGSMSLAEFEDVTCVPIATLKAELGLPQNIPNDERLGRLGREFGFDMDKVRDIVAKHRHQEAGEEPGQAGR